MIRGMRKAALFSTFVMLAVLALRAQQPGGDPAAREAQQRATTEDHQQMMAQLGIKALRPGPSGNESAPNHANYDEATANPYPNLPDVLTMKNGKKVTSAAMWKNQRRPEIVEDFEREVIGRIPPSVPKVTWEVTKSAEAQVGGLPVIGKQIVGHVDNSSYPDVKVDIQIRETAYLRQCSRQWPCRQIKSNLRMGRRHKTNQ